MTRTLLLIFAFIALVLGSFIWFVATWDKEAEQPVSLRAAPPFALSQMLISDAGQGAHAYAQGVYGVFTACVRPTGAAA